MAAAVTVPLMRPRVAGAIAPTTHAVGHLLSAASASCPPARKALARMATRAAAESGFIIAASAILKPVSDDGVVSQLFRRVRYLLSQPLCSRRESGAIDAKEGEAGGRFFRRGVEER